MARGAKRNSRTPRRTKASAAKRAKTTGPQSLRNKPSSPALRAAVHSYVHVARQHVDVKPYFKRPKPGFRAAGGNADPWSVPDLCAAYDWPSGDLVGGGVIAIVELDGGWVQSDMDKFFGGIGQLQPNIKDVSVDGTKNNPNKHLNDPEHDPDGEVALDIQVAAAAYYVATGKPATIRIYWAQDIAAAIRAATADGCDVCSISWGADEATWGSQAGRDMEKAATDATAAGMVVFAASGDNDSSDGGPKPRKRRPPIVGTACDRLRRNKKDAD
jgi:Subtilase family